MSSFFTAPASQRKRKRSEAPAAASKKRNTDSASSRPAKSSRRTEREESISGSESSDDDKNNFFTTGDHDGTDASEDENETAAEKRLRLAEQYLENIRTEVEEDDGGFDAAQIDRDRIAERLKEDVAETKGKIYRHIAEQLDFDAASQIFAKANQHAITACAARAPYAWTVSKDKCLMKWEIQDPKTYNSDDPDRPTNITPKRKPKLVISRRGNGREKKNPNYLGHTGAILSVAISDSGKYLATGDEDARLIIWDADSLTPKKLFTHHRGAITSLSFRRGTEQLFSASTDRTIKIWSASELAYIETLFGHQDSIVGIAGGLETNQETCVSVGSRDRTARLWKVVEESQLVFRGGGTARQKGMEKLRKGRFGRNVDEKPEEDERKQDVADDDEDTPIAYAEGSIDCVALLEAGLFVTGSDNGGLSLWSVNKKKPLFTLPLAHGRDPRLPAEEMSADADAATKGRKGPRLARYITALATVPFADVILTGSWDGYVRAWKVGQDKRSIEEIGTVGRVEGVEEAHINGATTTNDSEDSALARGVINGISVFERGDRGKDGLCIIAACSKEHRLGRWMKNKGRNGIAVFEVPKKTLAKDDGSEDEDEEEDDEE